MPSPFRARRIPAAEVRQIVKRAADLGALDPNAAATGKTWTEAELAERLSELGIPDDAVARAMAAEVATAPPSMTGAVRVALRETFEGVIPTERHENIAEAISAAMKFRGQVEVVGHKLTWTPGGLQREPAITVHSRDGRTEVSVDETLVNQGQLVVASITVAVFAGLFGTVPGIGLAKLLGIAAAGWSVAVVASFAIACACAAVIWMRKLFDRRVRTRTRELDEVMAKVVTVARGTAVSPPRARVALSAGGADADVDAAALEDAEAAQAELEADLAAEPGAARAMASR